MKKICIKKCRTCLGTKCHNYYGYMSKTDKKDYYGGVLHSRRPLFLEDIENANKKQPMDNQDWGLVYFLIVFTTLLSVFGGLLI